MCVHFFSGVGSTAVDIMSSWYMSRRLEVSDTTNGFAFTAKYLAGILASLLAGTILRRGMRLVFLLFFFHAMLHIFHV